MFKSYFGKNCQEMARWRLCQNLTGTYRNSRNFYEQLNRKAGTFEEPIVKMIFLDFLSHFWRENSSCDRSGRRADRKIGSHHNHIIAELSMKPESPLRTCALSMSIPSGKGSSEAIDHCLKNTERI